MSTKFALRTIALALAGSVLVFLLVGQLLADHWEVASARTVAAPPAAIAPLVRDLGRWADWSAVDFELGMPTARRVVGEPGAVGQRAVWQGPMGEATLALTAVADDRVDYEIRYRLAGDDGAVGGALTGHVAWAADGDGCRVTWTERGELTNLIQRWSHWFGALQEKVRQVQGASLSGLEQRLRRDGARKG